MLSEKKPAHLQLMSKILKTTFFHPLTKNKKVTYLKGKFNVF